MRNFSQLGCFLLLAANLMLAGCTVFPEKNTGQTAVSNDGAVEPIAGERYNDTCNCLEVKF